MISSVIAWVRGRSGIGSRSGQRSSSRLGDLAHQLAVARHALAVERRQHQAALAQVLGAVEQQHRARADDRRQRCVGLAGAQQLRIGGEDLLERDRVGDEDEGADLGEPDREPVAVATPARVQERQRSRDPGERLQRRRAARPGRKLGAHQPSVPAAPLNGPRMSAVIHPP